MRPRFTIRWLMIVIALNALIVGALELVRRRWFQPRPRTAPAAIS
jgi:hypothetical protein